MGSTLKRITEGLWFAMGYALWMVIVLFAFFVGVGVGIISQLPVFHPGERRWREIKRDGYGV